MSKASVGEGQPTAKGTQGTECYGSMARFKACDAVGICADLCAVPIAGLVLRLVYETLN